MVINLYKWLTDNNVSISDFTAYAARHTKNYPSTCNANYSKLLIKRQMLSSFDFNIPNAINYAFNWSTTKEGFSYWCELNSKWLKHLKNNGFKKGLSQIVFIAPDTFKIKG